MTYLGADSLGANEAMGEVRLAGVGASGLGAADEHRDTVAEGAIRCNTYIIFYGTTSTLPLSINHLRSKNRPIPGKPRPITPHKVESRAGAPTVGSGGDSVAFAPGLSPAPIVTFPAPAPRTRRADFRHRALQWDHAPRTRTAGATRAYRGGVGSPTSSAAAARFPLCISVTYPASRRACSPPRRHRTCTVRLLRLCM